MHSYLVWELDPPPSTQISACLYVLLFLYIDNAIVLLMGLYGQRVSSVYVPQGLELTPTLHGTCFSHGTTPHMLFSVEFFPPYGMNYAHAILTLEEQFLENWLVENMSHDGNRIFDDTMCGEEEIL